MKFKQDSLLVVDDNAVNRKILSRQLENQGYLVTCVDSGEEALRLIGSQAFDLVMLDIMMPNVDGLEVLRRIRARFTPAQLPVIMVTARDQSQDIVEALDLGANDYATKPVDFPVTLARVRTHLSFKRAEEALRESEERYTLAALGSRDGMWDWDLQSGEVYFSQRWKAMIGYEEYEIGNTPDEWFRFVHIDDIERLRADIASHLEGQTDVFQNEHRVLHKNGGYRWMLSRGIAVRDGSSKPTRIAGSNTDMTDLKIFDPLTGLPNKTLLLDRVERASRRSARNPDNVFGIIVVNIDDFKRINGSLGQTVADQVLIGFARKFQTTLRSADTVAYLGRDEFAVLLDEMKDVNDAMRAVSRIRKELEQPMRIGNHEVFATASMGVATVSERYTQPEGLLQEAYTALGRAKESGGNSCEVFEAQMQAQAASRLRVENDLRHAIERDELILHYQPIICLSSGQIVGAEALIRWKHPERGLVPPMEFIPVAERTGLIVPIGLWVLREACRQVAQWNRDSDKKTPLQISVNLSAKQFAQPDLAPQIERILEETGLSGQHLDLEITESVIMADTESAERTLRHLKALNIALSIDDFGTGYSSLSYLHRFRADHLKIDRSFVSKMDAEEECREIVRSLVQLATNLRMAVVAEGVETKTQLGLLRELGCGFAQGYLFSKPVEARAFAELLAHAPSW
jgi:diguanylate cyclase (GGDEF)-like protein/PAS domain S-box-containing protein